MGEREPVPCALPVGRPEGARDLLRTGSEAAQRAGADLHTVRAQARLAWLNAELGDTSEAEKLLARTTEGLARVHTPPGAASSPDGTPTPARPASWCASATASRPGAAYTARERVPLRRSQGGLAGSLLVMAEAHPSLDAARPLASPRPKRSRSRGPTTCRGLSGGRPAPWRPPRRRDEAERYRRRAVAIVDGLTARTRDPIIRTQLQPSPHAPWREPHGSDVASPRCRSAPRTRSRRARSSSGSGSRSWNRPWGADRRDLERAPEEGVMLATQVGSTFVIWSPPLEGTGSARPFRRAPHRRRSPRVRRRRS